MSFYNIFSYRLVGREECRLVKIQNVTLRLKEEKACIPVPSRSRNTKTANQLSIGFSVQITYSFQGSDGIRGARQALIEVGGGHDQSILKGLVTFRVCWVL